MAKANTETKGKVGEIGTEGAGAMVGISRFGSRPFVCASTATNEVLERETSDEYAQQG